MEHKPIAIMILPVFVIGILMLGSFAATVNAQESSNTGTEHIDVVSGANQQSILNMHNSERAAVGVPAVPALVWSESLASDALGYLHKMVADNQGVVWPTPGVKLIRHDPARPSTQGENLGFAARTGPPDPPKAPSLERLVGSWVAEKNDIPSGFTGAFPPGYITDPPIGHYTQMVWEKTKEVGCAAAIVRGMGGNGPQVPAVASYLICRYTPPGNYENQLPYPGFP